MKKLVILIILVILVIPSWMFLYYVRAKRVTGPRPTHKYTTPESEKDLFPDSGLADDNTTTGTDSDKNDKKDGTDKPQKPDVPVWNTLKNSVIGVSLQYPDIFKYGLAKSEEAESIEIGTYDVGLDYAQQPVGIKLSITRTANTNNEKLIDWAAARVGGDAPSVRFQDATIGGEAALQHKRTEGENVYLQTFVAHGTFIYTIVIVARDETNFKDHESLLTEMLGKITFTN